MATKKRGRPPTGKAMTQAERARKYRETRKAKAAKLKAAGGQALRVVLDRDAVDALAVCILAHSGLNAGELVAKLLKREASYLQGIEGELPRRGSGK